MSEDTNRKNPLSEAMRADPLVRAQGQLAELRDHWAKHGASNPPTPLIPKDPNKPGRDWLPEPHWISAGDAFDILRLQTEPYEYAPPIASICKIISDQTDRQEAGLNYALGSLPPTHILLKDFPTGSTHWFRALYSLLILKGADGIDGWEGLVSDLYEWIVMYDNLRIRTRDLLIEAIELDWPHYEFSLPEAKQEPVWSFPRAMAWIATRNYLALARINHFWRAQGSDEPVATDGVCKYNTRALGWLHTMIALTSCECGAFRDFGLRAYRHCTCISVAWEDLVRFRGGLLPDTPELVFNLQEGWLSMTWPDGADDIRFLRRDILDRWPANPIEQPDQCAAGSQERKRPGPAPDPDWPNAIAKVAQDCIAAGYKRPLKRGDKAAIQTMLLIYMADKDKHFSNDIAAKHAEMVIAALPDI